MVGNRMNALKKMKSKIKTVLKILAALLLLYVTFWAGMYTHFKATRHFQRNTTQRDHAQKLLEAAIALRQGDLDQARQRLDDCAATALCETAWDIPDDKMAALPPELLWLWQETKEYYQKYDPKGSMVGMVRMKLQSVPWSPFRVAQRAFAAKYGQGKLEIAPVFAMRHWFGPPLGENDTKGKVSLLDFWNTRCKPCVKSLPGLQEMYDTYKKQGFVVIGCTGGEKDETATFLKKNNYTFPAGMCTEQTGLNYAIEAVPTYFLIDRAGRLAWGPEHRLPTGEEVTAFLKQELPSSFNK
jgi:thiol-disulfide isomerase/thioredoxin